jgi:glycosyltransferase involved in cell wall biosynthesis
MPDLSKDVYTYPSLGWVADGNYRLGFPYFSAKKFVHIEPDIIHAHSPFMSMVLAERLRKKLDKPVVLSFYSKFSYDIEKYADNILSRNMLSKRILKSLNSADEIWVPAPGVACHLRDLGYSGGHYVIKHGTAMADVEVSRDTLSELRAQFNILNNETVLLFVGRMVWHKNIKRLINSLDALNSIGVAFKMLFIGDGSDREAIEGYVADKRLDGITRFVSLVSKPEQLCAFYDLADLLVFPSLSDNAPPAIIDAASRGLPTVVIEGSDAAYGIENEVTGFVCEAEGLTECISGAIADKRRLKRMSAVLRENNKRGGWEEPAAIMLKRYKTVTLER